MRHFQALPIAQQKQDQRNADDRHVTDELDQERRDATPEQKDGSRQTVIRQGFCPTLDKPVHMRVCRGGANQTASATDSIDASVSEIRQLVVENVESTSCQLLLQQRCNEVVSIVAGLGLHRY